MKKYLILASAAMAFAACSEPGLENDAEQNGELEQSYVSVTLKSDEASTRANDFEYGEDEERYVENVHFFFFKEDESAFPVTGVGDKNYVSFTLNTNGTQPGETGEPNEGPNVSDVKDKIIVLNNYKGQYPAYIVAVLNWDSSKMQQSYSMNNLYNALADIRNAGDHFVMSTSVYADNQGKVVKANNLTLANIAKTEADALANPVEIYVERISAKVQVEAEGNVTGKDATYDVNASVEDIPVYAKVLKWDLFNEYHQSIVLKHIYPETWGMTDEIGFLWNDANRFRSYWAGSYTGDFPADNLFDWTDGLNPGTGVAYCGENTRQAVKDSEGKITSDPRTKVIVKAQLVDAAGAPVEVGVWYGHKYLGEQAVRAEVASLLASQIFYADGTDYKPIAEADLKVAGADQAAAGADIEAYEVFFQLSDAGAAKDWFTYSNADGYKTYSDDALNAYLAEVEPAMIYKNGMTYYSTDIRHSGDAGSASEFGVVRNHVYKVNITNISGIGTPFYESDVDYDTPERPVDSQSYLAAEVRILSWRVVQNDYSVN